MKSIYQFCLIFAILELMVFQFTNSKLIEIFQKIFLNFRKKNISFFNFNLKFIQYSFYKNFEKLKYISIEI